MFKEALRELAEGVLAAAFAELWESGQAPNCCRLVRCEALPPGEAECDAAPARCPLVARATVEASFQCESAAADHERLLVHGRLVAMAPQALQ